MANFDIDEFRDYLEIDRAHLDAEIVQQPSLFYAVSEAYVRAVAIRDQVSDEMKAIDADLDLTIRENAESDGEKITEARIKSLVETDKAHGKAMAKFLEAKSNADQLLALKEAFHQRSYMLRDLVALFIANYFEKSSIEGNKDAKYAARKDAINDRRKGSHGQSRRKEL